MTTYAQQVIAKLQQVEQEDELQEYIGQAADLLFKAINPNYISGRNDIDNEYVTSVESEAIKQALAQIIQSNHNPVLLISAFFALGKSYDPALKDLYIAHLQTSVSQLNRYNSLVFQLLIALSNIEEDVFERDQHGNSSQGVLNVEKNVRQAQNYLLSHGIIIPW